MDARSGFSTISAAAADHQNALRRVPIRLFKPAAAYRVRRDTNTDTPLPPDEPAGENPPDGAVIDY